LSETGGGAATVPPLLPAFLFSLVVPLATAVMESLFLFMSFAFSWTEGRLELPNKCLRNDCLRAESMWQH
jgi:hypothetical protein